MKKESFISPILILIHLKKYMKDIVFQERLIANNFQRKNNIIKCFFFIINYYGFNMDVDFPQNRSG